MSRKGQLVTQYLERINREALEEYQHIVKGYVRDRQGVYALYRDRKLYYAGLASNLQFRLKQHLKDKHGTSWNRFSVYLTIGEKHLKDLESLLLRVIRPPGNKQMGKFVKAENLRNKFKRDVRSEQAKEMQKLIGFEPREKAMVREKERGRASNVTLWPKARRLQARYKGKLYRASVNKKGMIKFNSRFYKSLSGAARAVGCPSVDGWHFWKFEQAPGDWVPVSNLRK